MTAEISPTTSARVAKILIVDDHPAVREGLAVRIGQHPDLSVCGEADDVVSALQMIEETSPDVAVIDIGLKQGNGIDLIKRIKARNDNVRMIVWSMHNESLYAERALRAGALGYINKEHATEQIVSAIRAVLEGRLYVSDPMAANLLDRYVHGPSDMTGRSLVEALSDRELEVFELIGQGLETVQVAAKMRVSPKTVETYRARIKEKLNLNSAVELIRCAVQWVLEKH